MQVRLESKQDGLFRFKVNGRLTTQTLRNLDDPLDAMGDVVYRGMVLFDMVDAEFLEFKDRTVYFLRHQALLLDLCIARAEFNEQAGKRVLR